MDGVRVGRLRTAWLLWFLLTAGALAEVPREAQILSEQAGMYPVRASVSPVPLEVGRAHLTVEVDSSRAGAADPRLAVAYMLDLPSGPARSAQRVGLKGTRPGRFEGELNLPARGEWRLRLAVATSTGEFQLVSRLAVGKGVELARLAPLNPRAALSDPDCGPGKGPPVRVTCQPDPPRVGLNRLRIELPAGAGSEPMVSVGMRPAPSNALMSDGGANVPRAATRGGSPDTGVNDAGASNPGAAGARDLRATTDAANPVATRDLETDNSADAAREVGDTPMTDMPMGTLPRPAIRLPDGAYEVTVPLTMPGEWLVSIDLQGRMLEPATLTVPAPERPSVTMGAALLASALLVPGGLAWSLRRKPAAPMAACFALVLATLAAGQVIERYWPPASTGMDMSSHGGSLPAVAAPLPVITARAQRATFEVVRNYPAVVRADREVVLPATAGGIVLDLLEPGSTVRSGEVVARIGSPGTFDNGPVEGRIARSRLETAAGLPVRAPFPAVVLRRLVEPGAVVQAGAPVLVLGDVRAVRVEARVPLADQVPRGLPVVVMAGEESIAGAITDVSALTEGNLYRVEARVDNRRPAGYLTSHAGPRVALRPGDDGGRPGRLSVGQQALLHCVLEKQDGVLCVPREAVREDQGQAFVFVLQPVAGRTLARRRAVTTGSSNDTHVQVVSGLQEGESVVAVAEAPLEDGTLVTAGHWGTGAYRKLLLPQSDQGLGRGH